MKIVKTALLAVLPALALAACGQKAENKAGHAEEKAAALSAVGSGAQAGVSAPDTGADTGVAECDDYVTKMRACIKGKVPESQRAAMEKSFAGFKASGLPASSRAELAKICEAALDHARTAFKPMGCTF